MANPPVSIHLLDVRVTKIRHQGPVYSLYGAKDSIQRFMHARKYSINWTIFPTKRLFFIWGRDSMSACNIMNNRKEVIASFIKFSVQC